MAGRKLGCKVVKKNKICVACKHTFLSAAPAQVRCTDCRKVQLVESKRKEFNDNMERPDWRLRKLLSMAKNRARNANLLFDIDLEHLVSLWNSNEGRCVLTKREFELGRSSKGKVNPNAPSIDRIVPALGYTKGNVRLVTYHVNVALSEFGFEELKRLATDVLSLGS